MPQLRMASLLSRIVAAAVAVAVPLIVASAQVGASASTRPMPRLLGVFDDATGEPVGGAEVIDLATQKKAVTSVSGAISLAFLGPGVSVLQIRKIGYSSRLQTVTVSPADTVSITLMLNPLGHQLPEVRTNAANTVTGKLSMFEQHRAEGFGHFLTQEQLEKAQGRLTSDVLRTIPGIMLWPNPKSTAWHVATNRGGGSIGGGICLATVMVDGIMVYGGGARGQTPFNINTIRPEEMAGVEFYHGGATTPIAYGGTHNGCGTLVIWTR